MSKLVSEWKYVGWQWSIYGSEHVIKTPTDSKAEHQKQSKDAGSRWILGSFDNMTLWRLLAYLLLSTEKSKVQMVLNVPQKVREKIIKKKTIEKQKQRINN